MKASADIKAAVLSPLKAGKQVTGAYSGTILCLFVLGVSLLSGSASGKERLSHRQTENEVSPLAPLLPLSEASITAPLVGAIKWPLLRGVEMSVSKDTLIQTHGSLRLPVGKDDEKIDVERIRLKSGALEVEMLQSKKQRGLLIEAGNKVQILLIEGKLRVTRLSASVGIIMKEGSARIGREGRFQKWDAGNAGIFEAEAFREMPVLTAPEPHLKRRLFSHLDSAKQMRPRFQPVSKAVQYWMMVQDTQGRVRQLSHFRSPQRVPTIAVQTPGIFEASRWAANAYGLLSPQSERLRLQILGFGTGVVAISHQVVYFRPKQRLEVLGDDGLVLRFGRSSVTAQAHGSLRISSKADTSVEFWAPARPDERIRFKLKALEITGDVAFSPAKVVWPGSGVEVIISLDNIDIPPSEWQQMLRISCKLGLEKLSIVWKSDSRSLRGLIRPRKGAGPWVIRVAVDDALGRSITRNFHEVSGAKRTLKTALNSQSP